jgi:REP element-mobilizing transposase RayT
MIKESIQEKVMANTYTQINIHAIFAVNGRENIITEKFSEELFKYISGILSIQGQYPLAVNGYKDHVHIFFELSTTMTVAKVLEEVKSSSTLWIKDRRYTNGKFAWQKGYGAFSYSKSQRNDVIQYIRNQKEHHAGKTFREEYMDMLKKFDMSFEDAYLFEFYD